MLTVSNGWFNRVISPQRVLRVTSAGYAAQVSTAADTSRHMGPIDRLIDHRLFNGTKRQTLDHLFELARRSRICQCPVRTADPLTDRTMAEQNQAALTREQQHLNALLTQTLVDTVVEPGTEGEATGGAFLILRYGIGIQPVALSLAPLTPPNRPPRFEHADGIRLEHLAELQRSKGVQVGATMLSLRFLDGDGPLVVTSQFGPDVMALQATLSALWMRSQARIALDRLGQIRRSDATLDLNPTFLGLRQSSGQSSQESQESQEPHERKARLAWEVLKLRVQFEFDEAVRLIQRAAELERCALAQELSRMTTAARPAWLEMPQLEMIQVRVDKLCRRQELATRNVNRFKAEFRALCVLVGACVLPQMVDLFLVRIARFSQTVGQFAAGERNVRDVAQVNALLDTQGEFFRQFDSEQLQQCCELLDPPSDSELRSLEVDLSRASEAQAVLVNLLKDPCAGWAAVSSAMQGLRDVQRALAKARRNQFALVRRLDQFIELVSPDQQPGLATSSVQHGLSFYRPETFARIVSLRKICLQMACLDHHFTMQQLHDLRAQCKQHLAIVRADFDEIQKQRDTIWLPLQIDPSFSPVRHRDRSFVDHAEWQAMQRTREFNRKTSMVTHALEETRAATLDNYVALSKRSNRIGKLIGRTSTMHHHSDRLNMRWLGINDSQSSGTAQT
jgi:hypothetical protein